MPACLLAAIDRDAGRGVLVLEDLSHLEQGDSTSLLSRPRARSLVRALTGLHGPWWSDPGLHEASWLRILPHAWGRDWFIDRRARFMARFGDRLDGVTGPLLARIEPPYASARERLSAAPQTLLHGDLHLDNVLIDPGSDEVVLLDWAMVGRGPAAIDLAQVLFVIGEAGDRETLLSAYLDGLRDHDIAVGREELTRQLAAAVVVLFVTWTCAIAGWDPVTEREARILDAGIERARCAVHAVRGDVEGLV
jgi:Ser/Thr protein kinase RdoA (MazF antagonist)